MAAKPKTKTDQFFEERKRVGLNVTRAVTAHLDHKQAGEREQAEQRVATAFANASDAAARDRITEQAEQMRTRLADHHMTTRAQILVGLDRPSHAQMEIARQHAKELEAAHAAYKSRRETAFAAENWFARGAEKNALSHRLKSEFEAQETEMRVRQDDEVVRLALTERRSAAARQDPIEAFDRLHEALQADVYRLATIKFEVRAGKKQSIVTYLGERESDATPHLWSPDELRSVGLAAAEKRAKSGWNIYVMPRSNDWHYLVVDDLSPASLDRMRGDGYAPAAVIETSSSNLQAILVVPKTGGPIDGDAANALVRRINRAYEGDRNFAGAEHLHRLGGYWNTKPGREQADGSYPPTRLLEGEHRACSRAARELAELRDELANRPAPAISITPRAPLADADELAPAKDGPAPGRLVALAGPLTADQDTLVLRFMMHRAAAADRILDAQNPSHLDYHAALRMRATGHSPADIGLAVELGGPSARSDDEAEKHAWPKYSAYVARAVFGPDGDRALESAQKWADVWRRDEAALDEQIASQKQAGPEF